uniref:Uncharacterized protein n=1 Tax=Arundo donax TaxID=35708 RepID=A0A0A9FY69_ARUDO
MKESQSWLEPTIICEILRFNCS